MKKALAVSLLAALGAADARAQEVQFYFSSWNAGYSRMPVRPPYEFSGCAPGRSGYYTSGVRADRQWVHLPEGSVTVREGSAPEGPCAIVKRKADGMKRLGADVNYYDDPVVKLPQDNDGDGTQDNFMLAEGQCGIECENGNNVAFSFADTGLNTAYTDEFGGFVYIRPGRDSEERLGQQIVEYFKPCFIASTPGLKEDYMPIRKTPQAEKPKDEVPVDEVPDDEKTDESCTIIIDPQRRYCRGIKSPFQISFEAYRILNDDMLNPGYEAIAEKGRIAIYNTDNGKRVASADPGKSLDYNNLVKTLDDQLRKTGVLSDCEFIVSGCIER